jgi:UDP-N-acetylglucosamine 3-dehydrogenase
VIGLGMIGRHHARLLQTSPRIEFAGAVDPAGDRFGVVHERDRLFASLDVLLRAGAPDFAIVAVPTEEHLATVRALASEGVHVLVEKPLAATAVEARAIIEACSAAGVHGAVGHVERFNPALLALRQKAHIEGQLGQIFLISTERIGPFPDRIRDVGVIKDLATHDLDLVHWLGGAPVERVTAETQHRMGREHEDVVMATGRLENAISFNCIVDWLSPTKVRRTRVLGERGMLVADTLTADLSFYENGSVTSDWQAAQSLKGVSEGNMTRYALARREPLLVELETFCDLIGGDAEADVVTLAQGLETVVVAEAALASSQAGSTVTMAGLERPEADRRVQTGGLDAPRGLQGRDAHGQSQTAGLDAPRRYSS